MGRKKKPVEVRMQEFSESLNEIFNTDEWHQYFDLYNEIESDPTPSETKAFALKCVEQLIELRFGSETKKFRNEAEYILKNLSSIVLGWIVKGFTFSDVSIKEKIVKNSTVISHLFAKEDAGEIIGISLERILVSGKYDPLASEASRYSYIKKVAFSVTMDALRKKQNGRELLMEEPGTETHKSRKAS